MDTARAQFEDAHWAGAHRRERYYSPALDYEDYAPAYCVGYIGYAQYGGRFEDAEPSLCANWERIKGDSRLPLPQALQAIRAAWDRMEATPKTLAVARPAFAGLVRHLLGKPSFSLGMKLMRWKMTR